MQKRGQLTIFIIIAIVIIAAAVIVFLFWPRISSTFFQVEDPEEFIQDCLEEDLEKNVNIISKQGGSLNPTNSVMFRNDKIDYLCYTADYYLTCYMQKPLLKQSVEDEIKNSIKSSVDSCFSDLKNNLEDKGNNVVINKGEFSVELFPSRIRVLINYPLSISNQQGTTTEDEINININSNLYDLISIATSIANWEARYGDAETTVYMTYYPNIKVEKNLLNDGSKVYVITERNTNEEFKFASRSLVLPPGYGG